MKQKFYLVNFLLWVFAVSTIPAQRLNIPRASPIASITQYVGVCKITVDYCRPSVRERPIFNALVPYGKVWRAGANEATVISFDQSTNFGGSEVPAGIYGIFVIPQDKEWTLILNKVWNQWGAYNYDADQDIIRISLPVKDHNHVEILTYFFDQVTKTSANLNLAWDQKIISIPLKTNTHRQTLTEIENAVKTSRQNWYTYSAAAQYHYYELKEAQPALAYLDVAIALKAPNPAPWMLKSQILAALGKYPEAIQAAEEAIEVCNHYNFEFEVEENEDNIHKWKKM